MGEMVLEGPKEAADMDDRGVQRLQVNNKCPVHLGENCILGSAVNCGERKMQ